MFASILAAVIAALRAFPAAASLISKFLDAWKAYEDAQQAKVADERKAAKDSAVDAAIDGVLYPKSQAGQQQAPDRKT